MAELYDNGDRAPLNDLLEASKRDAVRDQVRLMARVLGLTVSEADAEQHAADLLALVAAERVSGVASHAVAAHLLDTRIAAHNAAIAARQEKNNALTERIAAALETLARGKGHDEPAQSVSGAAATYSAQQIADLRELAQMVSRMAPTPAGEWDHGRATALVRGCMLKVFLHASVAGEKPHCFSNFIPEGCRDAALVARIAATCRAIATRAEGSPRSLDELVALELEGAR